MSGGIRRISNLKFIVKNIPTSPSPSVTKTNKPSQCLPQMISSTSGDCSKNPLLGLEKTKNHHHHQVLEIEKKKEGCRLGPQVKYSTWDEILRKTKRIDSDQDGEVDDMSTTKQRMMKMSPSLSNPHKHPDQGLSHSAVFKGSSSSVSVIKGSSSSVVNLKQKPPLVMHQGHDDASAINSSTAKPSKTVSMNSSTAKANKPVNAMLRKSAAGQAAVPVLVRRKSKQHDSDSRHMQSKANKALILPSKRPRNQDDDDDNEKSALNFKRRKATLTSSGVKPKRPAESPQTSPASSCQTVVSSSCRISKKAVDSMNVSSDASSVINILPADKQPKVVFKNAAAHSNTIGEKSPQDDDCDISPIIDEDTTRKGWLPASLRKKLSFITRKGELPGSPWRR